MAIIKCSECGSQVSTLAEKCPHCGCPVNSSNAEAVANNSSASASVPTPSNSSKPKNRKLIWSIFAVIIAAIVGVALYFTIGSKSDSEDVAKTTAPYKVGDYYNENGKEGVVFDVWDDGRHGKIVSLDEAYLQWCTYRQYEKGICVGTDNHDDGKYSTGNVMSRRDRDCEEYPAFVWCREKGEDWYLPATNELELIYENMSKINSTLRKLEYDEITGSYWSSTEDDEFCAWYVFMGNGYTYNFNKNSSNYVRAVSAF